MTDEPIRHIDEDGSIYTAEIVPPEGDAYGAKYHVDLVRATVDASGRGREQRLTVGQHNSWMEAEEQLDEVEDKLERNGIAGWGEDADRLRQQPFEEDTFYMTTVYPPDAPEGYDSAAQLLAVTESGIVEATLAVGERETMERMIERIDTLGAEEGNDRLLAAARVEAEINGGLPPATPLFNRDDSAVRHIDGGGTAHWFAIAERDTSDETELYELRYFRALEMDDGTEHTDSYPVMPLPDDDPGSAWAMPGLEMYLQKGDVYMAQQFAHDVADSYGEEFPAPMDLPALDPHAKYYFGYGVGANNQLTLEAVKTWMDGVERRFDTLTVGEYSSFDEADVDERQLETLLDEQGVEAAMNLAEMMAITNEYLDPNRADGRIFFTEDAPPDSFTTIRERELAGPEYSVGAVAANGEAFLDVTKTWGKDNYEKLVIPQPDWEMAHDVAERANDLMEQGHLQGAMQLVEDQGVSAGVIDAEREDPRLFTQGPLDPFTTIREEQIDDELARYGVTWRETYEWAQPTQPELDPELEVKAVSPYWRLDTIPVNDPEGEPLGHALHMVVYDGVEHNPKMVGTPAIPDDESFRMLEVAHFKTTEAADKFGVEFNGYLMPGLLEGPELAVEVARLEGHPVEWKTLDGQELDDYRNLKLTLTRDPADWQPYNPNAERDARIEAEGFYTDPIHQFTIFDEDEDDPKVESATPDFDL
ncbi:MAG: hypothetical protein D6711_09185 [Chloroflexi bacterium]|nr:MAG: hypothetical protein D6711_09185 [Chloroflexota bacterium]